MEEEQRELNSFINLHGHKAKILKERCIYLTKWSRQGIDIDVDLSRCSMEDICSIYDTESHLTQWTLNQISTYNPEKEVVVGLEFDGGKILSHVIRLIQYNDDD
jgi:hypothetical protein